MTSTTRRRRLARAVTALAAALAPALAASCDGHFANPIESATLEISISGLPEGVEGTVTVQLGDGPAHEISGSEVLPGLPFGVYDVVAEPVEVDGETWAPSPAEQEVVLDEPTTYEVSVVYALVATTGTLTVHASGLPEGGHAEWSLRDGDGEEIRDGAVQGDDVDTLEGLAPGAYTLRWSESESMDDAEDWHTWRAQTAEQTVTIVAGQTADLGALYALATGGLTVSLSGLPEGEHGAVTLEPAGSSPFPFVGAPTAEPVAVFDVVSGGSVRRTNIPAGTYVARWHQSRTASDGNGFQEFATEGSSAQVTIAASLTPGELEVTYEQITGSLTIDPLGLPSGALVGVKVYAFDSDELVFDEMVAAGKIITSLQPRKYMILWADTEVGGQTYVADSDTSTAIVTAGSEPAVTSRTYSVPCAPATGTVDIVISGLPSGRQAGVIISGEAGYVFDGYVPNGTTTVVNVPPGSYTAYWYDANDGYPVYGGAQALSTVTVTSGATSQAAMTYVQKTAPAGE